MHVVCSYCRKDMGQKDPKDDESISHGMCLECEEHYRQQWGGLELGRYLDQYDLPVIVVEEGGRVLAANHLMAQMLGKNERELFGLLGGEAMECQYSRLPERCGNTIHCKTCTIRNTVSKAFETGEPQHRVPAHLDQDSGRIRFKISAFPKDDHVTIIIDEILEPHPK